VVLRVVEYPPVRKLLPRGSLLQQAAQPVSLLPQPWRIQSARLPRSTQLRSQFQSNGVQWMPTLVHAKTEWSLKISTRRLNCEHDPRCLLEPLHCTNDSQNVHQPPTQVTRVPATTNAYSFWDVFTPRPVVTCTISPHPFSLQPNFYYFICWIIGAIITSPHGLSWIHPF
jgi:hypothetical protein